MGNCIKKVEQFEFVKVGDSRDQFFKDMTLKGGEVIESGEDVYFVIDGQKSRIVKGDYIVKNENGEYSLETEESFLSKYSVLVVEK